MFFLYHNKNIPYLLAPNLKGYPNMLHAFTTRLGGISEGEFSELNLALHVGDNIEDVLQNRRYVAEIFGLSLEDSVAIRQVHGTNVQIITAHEKGQGATSFDENLISADALVTNEPGILLWTFYADCVPILMFDPVRNVISTTHAGWRGTYAHIAQETVKVMKEHYGCRPQDIQAAIGPSLGPCCFEVGQEVQKLFSDAGFTEVILRESGKIKIDLWQANLQVLLDAGLRKEHISLAELCTSCLNNIFFSYRADKSNTGRFAAAIMLKK